MNLILFLRKLIFYSHIHSIIKMSSIFPKILDSTTVLIAQIRILLVTTANDLIYATSVETRQPFFHCLLFPLRTQFSLCLEVIVMLWHVTFELFLRVTCISYLRTAVRGGHFWWHILVITSNRDLYYLLFVSIIVKNEMFCYKVLNKIQ